ncbi:hypothetical protein GQ42DRAFT_128312 [Ramicandelaber brevisporus]|nr:hypothetical protein GQ42DRAFT_128312 [Ramicandelaber brevisporus]
MFIAIAGTVCSGRETLVDYLVSTQRFRRLYLRPRDGNVVFERYEEMLDYVTLRWRRRFVTSDLQDLNSLKAFRKRPFFVLLTVDAPLMMRFERYMSSKRSPPSSMAPSASPHSPAINSSTEPANINKLLLAADLVVFNPYADLLSFHRHLDQLDISNPERLRPSWDTYFMLLSELAAHRSNCMKRRVGCILVRNHQIIATGYNGTPKGLRNCNEGGCPRCNAAAPCGTSLDHCLCLHAEENALLEAGRSRLGDLGNCVLYCNTCPCLGCAKKIVQVGISEVVYSQSYGMDHLSARMFREAGVILRQHSPPTLRLDVQPSSHLAI